MMHVMNCEMGSGRMVGMLEITVFEVLEVKIFERLDVK